MFFLFCCTVTAFQLHVEVCFVCSCVMTRKAWISRWKMCFFCSFLALNMTSASSFQMLRGAVIIFTGLLSVAFLGRRLAPSQWLGMVITILGLVIVGLADFLNRHQDDTHKLSDIITGKGDFSYRMLYLFIFYSNQALNPYVGNNQQEKYKWLKVKSDFLWYTRRVNVSPDL